MATAAVFSVGAVLVIFLMMPEGGGGFYGVFVTQFHISPVFWIAMILDIGGIGPGAILLGTVATYTFAGMLEGGWLLSKFSRNVFKLMIFSIVAFVLTFLVMSVIGVILFSMAGYPYT